MLKMKLLPCRLIPWAVFVSLMMAEVAVSFHYDRLPSFRQLQMGLAQPERLSMSKRGGSRKEGFLKIAEAPPKILTARQHGKSLLECSASGSPAPEITWYKDGKPLLKEASYSEDYIDFNGKSMSETKSQISLDCVSEDDAGLYECVAYARGNKASVGTEVHVVSFSAGSCNPRALTLAPPRIHQWMGTYMQEMGGDARISCRSEGAHQTAWIAPNDQTIEGNSDKYTVLDNGDLVIHDLGFTDMGMFKCVVSNNFGQDMKETFVYPHGSA